MKSKIALIANIVFVVAGVLACNTTLAKAKKTSICHMLGNGGSIVITVSDKAVEKHVTNHLDATEYVVNEDGSCTPMVPELAVCVTKLGGFPPDLINSTFLPTTGELFSIAGEVPTLEGVLDYAPGNEGELFSDGNILNFTIDEAFEFSGTSTSAAEGYVEFDLVPSGTLQVNEGLCGLVPL